MATITVTTLSDVVAADGQVSLREAIQAANTDIAVNEAAAGSGADTITFDASLNGTIYLDGGDGPGGTAGSTLEVSEAVTIDGGGRITISGDADNDDVSTGGTSDITDIFATAGTERADNVQILSATGDLTLDGLTLTGGVEGSFDEGGGAVRGINVTVTLTNTVVSGNEAFVGGGIAADTVNLTNSTVSDNSGRDNSGGIRANTANLTNTTVSGNRAIESGGGIAASTANLTNSTVSGNDAGDFGGGILATTANLTNTTISGNSAGFGGGGIFADTATLTNSIVLGNIGGANDEMSLSSEPTLAGGNIVGTTVSNDGVSTGTPTSAAEVFAQTVDIDSSAGSTVLAGVLADNGGPVQTIALKGNAANPAIDGGDDTLDAATDARGEARVDFQGVAHNGANISDLGAFEAQAESPSLVVTTLNDVVNDLDGLTSLREAVAYANSLPGLDTITFSPSLGSGGTITLASTLSLDEATALEVGLAVSISLAGSGLVGSGGLTKEEGGTLVLGEANTYTGATTVNGGTLRVDGTIVSAVTVSTGIIEVNGAVLADVIVNDEGILGGHGTVADVVVNPGGELGPGASPGILNTGNLTFHGPGPGDLDSILSIELGGTDAGVSYDQVKVTGTVTLHELQLDLQWTGEFHPETGESLIIINNDGSDAITGAAVGNMEGTIIEFFQGNTFRLTFVGGDGNDMALVAINDAPAATNLTQTKAYAEGVASVALDSIVVSDPDPGDILTLTLTLSNPLAGALSASGAATYDPSTGVWAITGSAAQINAALAAGPMTFVPAPNNDLDVTITTHIEDAAGTGPADGLILLDVTPSNDAPVITSDGGGLSASVALAENDGAVTIVAATDIDGPALAYAIAGGADAALFVIDPVTGALSFAAVPDFDAPADADGDNFYEVIVEVSDGAGGTDSQTFTVGIENIGGVTIVAAKDKNIVDASNTVPGQPFPTDEEDVIQGGSGKDSLSGLGGDDVIIGGRGKDLLFGGEGDDRIAGGLDKNQLTGGTGDDTFLFDRKITGKHAGFSEIADFRVGDDGIELSQAVFKKLDLGGLSDAAFRDIGEAGSKDYRIAYKQNGNLLYDKDGKGGTDAVLFAKLTSKPDIDASDFLVVG